METLLVYGDGVSELELPRRCLRGRACARPVLRAVGPAAIEKDGAGIPFVAVQALIAFCAFIGSVFGDFLVRSSRSD